MADEKDIEAEDQIDDPQPEVNLGEKVDKLERLITEQAKTLESVSKASAGKDKKITELAAGKRKLEDETLSKDTLNELRANELKQQKLEWEAESAVERAELEELRTKIDKRTVLDGLAGFPPELAEYVTGANMEEIETNALKLMALWVKDRTVVSNVRKVTGVPGTGTSKSAIPIKANELAAKAREEQREWGENAEDDDFLKVVTEQQQGKLQ